MEHVRHNNVMTKAKVQEGTDAEHALRIGPRRWDGLAPRTLARKVPRVRGDGTEEQRHGFLQQPAFVDARFPLEAHVEKGNVARADKTAEDILHECVTAEGVQRGMAVGGTLRFGAHHGRMRMH